jgi:hypothetical protein
MSLFKGSDIVMSDYSLPGQTCIKVFCLGCAYATVTPETPTLCCLTTACLGNTYIKVFRMGYALATVTPEDVLIIFTPLN